MWRRVRLLTTAWQLGFGFYRFGRFFRRHQHLLPDALTVNERRRARHYLLGAAYLHSVFSSLLQYRLRPADRAQTLRLSALACFFDDLSDRHFSANNTTDNPETFAGVYDRRGIALPLLRTVEQHLPPDNRRVFQTAMQQVFAVETAARQRGLDAPEPDELEQLGRLKGGGSVLMFRCLLAPPVSGAEQHALEQFGALIQLSDDIFDVYFDIKAGIHTLASFFLKKNDLSGLADRFEAQLQRTRAAWEPLDHQAGYTPAKAQYVLHFLVIITRLCLAHYAGLQKKHGNLPLDQRRLMVLDMEAPRNRLAAARLLLVSNL